MGAATLCSVRCYCSFLALLLCFQFFRPSQAFKLRGGYDDEKAPLAVIVPDPSPELSPLAAPPPVSGADSHMRPRLPTERWPRGRGEDRGGTHSPAAAAALLAPVRAPALAEAPATDSGSGATFIRSSPAVPVPRGVTDTATILPMPAPGDKRRYHRVEDVGAAALVRVGMVPLVVGFIMMASFRALC